MITANVFFIPLHFTKTMDTGLKQYLYSVKPTVLLIACALYVTSERERFVLTRGGDETDQDTAGGAGTLSFVRPSSPVQLLTSRDRPVWKQASSQYGQYQACSRLIGGGKISWRWSRAPSSARQKLHQQGKSTKQQSTSDTMHRVDRSTLLIQNLLT